MMVAFDPELVSRTGRTGKSYGQPVRRLAPLFLRRFSLLKDSDLITVKHAMKPATPTSNRALQTRVAVLCLTLFASWPSAAQASQKLFESSDLLPRADERRFLDSDENDAVARMRGPCTNKKEVKVLRKLNLDALYEKAITIVMPDGEEVTYVGGVVESSSPSIRSWIGSASNHNGHLAITMSLGSFLGDAAYKGRGYVISSLAYGQKYFFAEVKTLGPHQGEPLSCFPTPSASQPKNR